MLMGHSYLIAPAMSLTPLMRLLAALALAVAVRAGGGRRTPVVLDRGAFAR